MSKSRNRVIDVLNHRIPDRIPYLELLISAAVIEQIHPGIDYFQFCKAEDIDLLFIKKDFQNRWIDKERQIYTNEWKMIRKSGPEDTDDYIDGPIKNLGDLKKFRPPDPLDERNFKTLKEVIGKYKNEKIISFLTKATFNHPWYLMGSMQNYLMEYYLNPKMIEGLHRITEDYYVPLTKRAIELGADVIALADDYAYRYKMFIPRDKFKRYCLPSIEKLVGLAHSYGRYVLFHSDGNLEEVIDLIIDAGIDMLHPIEPGAMDIQEIYKKYRDRVIMCGNVDCAHTLTFGTTDDVVREVIGLIRSIAPEGRYIMSSSNTIHSHVNPENYRAMLETLKTYGRYPIGSC
jgi:uroporphyrinogen decarboxylase